MPLTLPLSRIPKCHLPKKEGGMSITEAIQLFNKLKLKKTNSKMTKKQICKALKDYYKKHKSKQAKKPSSRRRPPPHRRKVQCDEDDLDLYCYDSFDEADFSPTSRKHKLFSPLPIAEPISPIVYEAEILSDVSDLSEISDIEEYF